MTRRERLISILTRLECPLGAVGYDLGTDKDLEELARNGLWWRGLNRHNMRVLRGWMEESTKRLYANSTAPLQESTAPEPPLA